MSEKESVPASELSELERTAFVLAYGQVHGPINDVIPDGMSLVQTEHLEELKEHLPDEVYHPPSAKPEGRRQR